MAITRKPLESEAALPTDFDAYLRKGGSSANAEPVTAPAAPPEDIRFTLKIPGVLCAQIDELRGRRVAKTSRHQWVLEAIEQRIERESV